jgi:hypothetical protein
LTSHTIQKKRRSGEQDIHLVAGEDGPQILDGIGKRSLCTELCKEMVGEQLEVSGQRDAVANRYPYLNEGKYDI